MGGRGASLRRLAAILRERGAVMERDLLRSSGIPKPTLMRLLRELEFMGLVERRRHGRLVEVAWMGGDIDIEAILEARRKLKESLSPLPAIVKRLFREDEEYVAVGWYGLLYPRTPFVASHARIEFLVSHDILRCLGGELKIEIDGMEYEVKLYSVPSMFKAESLNGVKVPRNPLKAWLLTRSLMRGVPEELAELVMATYSPVARNPIAQAIRAKLLGLVTGKEPVIDIDLDHPIILRYGDIDVNVDWLDDLWKRGIMLYLNEYGAKRAVEKLIATIGYRYVITV